MKELVLQSLEEGDAGGVVGDMRREGFFHEEVPIWLSPAPACKLLRKYLHQRW